MKKFFKVSKNERILIGLLSVIVITLIIVSIQAGKKQSFLLKVNGDLYFALTERDSIIDLQNEFIAFQEANIDSVCFFRDELIGKIINQKESDFKAIDFFVKGLLSEKAGLLFDKALLEQSNLELRDELLIRDVIIETFRGEGVGPREPVPEWVIREEGSL